MYLFSLRAIPRFCSLCFSISAFSLLCPRLLLCELVHSAILLPAHIYTHSLARLSSLPVIHNSPTRSPARTPTHLPTHHFSHLTHLLINTCCGPLTSSITKSRPAHSFTRWFTEPLIQSTLRLTKSLLILTPSSTSTLPVTCTTSEYSLVFSFTARSFRTLT